MTDQKGVRLSLASAQEKLPVSLKDNKIRIPMNGAPSSHILKTPIKDLHETVENETTLAPFYDLLSTYVYAYAKRMAIRIGGGSHFHFLTPKYFERFSRDTQIKYKVVKDTILTMADNIVGEAKKNHPRVL